MLKRLNIAFLLALSLIITGCGSKTDGSSTPVKAEQKKETGYEHKKSEFDFTNAELTEENVMKAIKQYLNKSQVSDVSVKISKFEDKDIISISYYYKKQSDDKWIEDATYISNDIFQALGINKKLYWIEVINQSEILDKYGNKTSENIKSVMFRENFDQVNWDNLNKMVKEDYKSLHKVADFYVPKRMVQ